MSGVELKPCPFCGSEASIGNVVYPLDSETAKLNGRNIGFYGHCIVCSASLCFDVCEESPEKAAEAWNRRPK